MSTIPMRHFAFTVALLACSPAGDVDDVLIDARAPRVVDATTDATGFGFGQPTDASGADHTFPSFNGGGPFLCGDCMCDGTLFYCVVTAPSLDAGDASACGADAGYCHPIPPACLPKPTCACVVGNSSCSCDVDPSGNGLMIGCGYEHKGGPV